MFPKLYWDANGKEHAIADEKAEKRAIKDGWSDVPSEAHAEEAQKHVEAKREKPYLSDAENAERVKP